MELELKSNWKPEDKLSSTNIPKDFMQHLLPQCRLQLLRFFENGTQAVSEIFFSITVFHLLDSIFKILSKLKPMYRQLYYLHSLSVMKNKNNFFITFWFILQGSVRKLNDEYVLTYSTLESV